jgi:hypothetical protein
MGRAFSLVQVAMAGSNAPCNAVITDYQSGHRMGKRHPNATLEAAAIKVLLENSDEGSVA